MKGGKFGQKLKSVSYMHASLGIFVFCLILLLLLLILSVLSRGGLLSWQGILGFFGMLLSLGGFLLPLYGKFIVRTKDKPDYRLGLLLNGGLFRLYLFFYFLGV